MLLTEDRAVKQARDSEPIIDVDIDVRPNNARNQVNLKSNMPVPIAILSTEDLDATQVDIDTITLNGVSTELDRTRVNDVNGDGIADLVVYYRARDLAASGALDADSVDIALEGALTDSLIRVRGTDSVSVRA